MSDINDISWWNPPERIKQLCLQSDHSISYNNHGFYSPFKQHSYITHAPYPVSFRTPMISNGICEPTVYDYNIHSSSSFVTPFINPRLLVTETSNDLSTYPSSITHSILGQQQRTPDQTIEGGFVDSNSATLSKQSQLAIIPPESRQTVFTSLTENITQVTSPNKTAYSSNNNDAYMEENNQGITHTNEFSTLISTMSSQQHSTDIHNKPRQNRFLEEENRRDARRRERNRLAARRHRNKKRYKSDQLESQVHELMVENERLKGLEAEVERLKGLLGM
ncbi:15231_t:CDS:2 [Cetraspora pellucida]|uniref:15231_t:CDS:1 n=1 Tax=Cetraspora pellucida TaxID=1433469 RepID=A0ACA9NCB3_9GLOM|nr:15231_t:CDS:2 [Cetraspora pellucida]